MVKEPAAVNVMLLDKTSEANVAHNVKHMDSNMTAILHKAHRLIIEACALGLILDVSSSFVSPLDRTRVFHSKVYPDRTHSNHPDYTE